MSNQMEQNVSLRSEDEKLGPPPKPKSWLEGKATGMMIGVLAVILLLACAFIITWYTTIPQLSDVQKLASGASPPLSPKEQIELLAQLRNDL